ncbi:MAG: DUF4139 domain-containing protein [Kiritimatiellaeota bacterium]|nr:DUF4139 domain-containing protein [Kiritimatiellota bacterium]
MSHLRLMMGLAVVAGAAAAAENEPLGEAPITALALFKNGVVSVMREVRPPAGGAFLLTDKIEPAHGTLWCGAEGGFRLTTVSRTFEKTLDTPPLNDICKAYDGQRVTVTFLAATTNALAKGEGMLALFPAGGGANVPTDVTGTVVNPLAPEQAKNFSRDYGEYGNHYRYDDLLYSRARMPVVMPSHLTLRLESGQHVSIPVNLITGIQSAKMNTTVKEAREVWRIEGAQKPFAMAYLAKGMAWAPAYRLTLMDDKQMNISMSAIIRNEMAPFKDADVNLISGFPNIEFANRTSLIVPGSTLASFFQGLARVQGERGASIMSQNIMSNRAMPGNDAGYDLPAVPSEEATADIHYRGIGKLTMGEGETLYLPLEQAKAPYERIVEWIIPDRRDIHGRIHNRGQNPEDTHGTLWDTLAFSNPFKSPITTAPIEVTDGAKVLGQSTISWVNPGQQASVKITKALSVSGGFSEVEVDQKRPLVNWGGSTYRNPDVEGEFRVKNYRATPAKVTVRLQVSGEYLSAAAEPTGRRVLEAGVYAANKRQELTWTLTLAPGEEQTVTYRYSVLILH